jgi:hypothetical protein
MKKALVAIAAEFVGLIPAGASLENPWIAATG